MSPLRWSVINASNNKENDYAFVLLKCYHFLLLDWLVVLVDLLSGVQPALPRLNDWCHSDNCDWSFICPCKHRDIHMKYHKPSPIYRLTAFNDAQPCTKLITDVQIFFLSLRKTACIMYLFLYFSNHRKSSKNDCNDFDF